MPRTSQRAPAGRRRYHAPALEKGLDILELLATAPDGLTQAGIARALGRSVSEIFRMLNCLLQRGYVAIERPGDQYVLTLKLFELARRHPATERLVRCALPLMKALAQETDQSCHLTLAEGGRGLVVAQVDSPGDLGFSVRVGSEMNLAQTASGHVLLAFCQDRERDALLRQHELRSGPEARREPPTDRTSLRRRLKRVRQRGYEEMESGRARGVHDLSFPVVDSRGQALAALTMPFVRRLDRDEKDPLGAAREALARTAQRLSAALAVADPRRAARVEDA